MSLLLKLIFSLATIASALKYNPLNLMPYSLELPTQLHFKNTHDNNCKSVVFFQNERHMDSQVIPYGDNIVLDTQSLDVVTVFSQCEENVYPKMSRSMVAQNGLLDVDEFENHGKNGDPIKILKTKSDK